MMKQTFISRTLALVFTLIVLVCSGCESGQFYFDVKNNRNNSIKLIYSWIIYPLDGSNSGKFVIKINPGETGGDGGFGRGEHLSDDLAYVIIKDNDDNELMNLRGEALENAVTIEIDDENHVHYRLDVN